MSQKIRGEYHLERYNGIYQIPGQADRDLCIAAVNALEYSYSPYSKFPVSAAVLLDDGTIVKGANQENAVYPLGICAERVALSAASGQFPDHKVVAIAVTSKKPLVKGELPAFPCGSCRQTLIEYEQRSGMEIRVHVFGTNEEVYTMNSIKQILPFAFDRSFLGKARN